MTSTSERPTENAIERDARVAQPSDELKQEPDILPEPYSSEITGLLLVPGFRFNGTATNPPWNLPEENIFAWLSASTVEIVEDRVLSGDNGSFWGRTIKPDGDVQSIIIKFAGIGKNSILETWGTEFQLETPQDLLTREVSSYEVLKVLGGEDLGFPICLKDLNSVELLSDVTRERLASVLRTSMDNVDDRLGIAGSVQLVARDTENFAGHWAVLGASNDERWRNASDELRYSIYRANFIDFILGTPNRSTLGFLYNRNTDKLMMPDLMTSFPHSGYSAEKYIQMRFKGWGRSSGGAARFVDNTPPTANDFTRLFSNLSDEHLEEAIMTAQQIVVRMNDEMVGRLAMTLLEYQVPIECVASVVLRVAYLGLAPGSVIKRPVEFIRNICVPIRAGAGTLDDKAQEIISYVNDIMTNIMEEEFDISKILSQPLPDLAELLV